VGKSSRAWVGVSLMGDDPVNNPTDDEAYEPGEVARVRRDSVDDRGRRGPNRPGAPSAPPPPAESFRPAGPPPPADWFKPAGGRGGAAGGHSGRPGADETIRPRRDAYGVDGPGSAGYTSQPGIPVERYPTPRPGEFPSPVPSTRRAQPPSPPSPSHPDGARGPQGRAGQDRPTEYLGRVGAGDAAGRSSGQGSGVSRPTERLSYDQYGDQYGDDPVIDTAAPTEFGPAANWPQEQDAGGWQQARESGGWRDTAGGFSAGAAGGGAKSGAGSAATEEKPPKRRRRRGRLIALIVVVVLLVLAIPADRFAAHIAVGVMRDKVELAVAENMKDGQQPPIVRKVSLGGFPFLTQVLFGKFKDIGVTLENIPTTADGPKIAGVDAHLKGVHVPLGDAITDKVGKVPVDNVEATVSITYDQINAFLKDQPFHWQLAPINGGKQVKITGSDTQKILGTTVDVQLTGVGSFTVENNQLKITPSDVQVGGSVGGLGGSSGLNLGSLLSNAAVPVPLPLPDNLPFDLTIVSAGTNATGLAVTASAKDVVLPAQAASK